MIGGRLIPRRRSSYKGRMSQSEGSTKRRTKAVRSHSSRRLNSASWHTDFFKATLCTDLSVPTSSFFTMFIPTSSLFWYLPTYLPMSVPTSSYIFTYVYLPMFLFTNSWLPVTPHTSSLCLGRSYLCFSFTNSLSINIFLLFLSPLGNSTYRFPSTSVYLFIS